MENRPYLRSVKGKVLSLKDTGEAEEAVTKADGIHVITKEGYGAYLAYSDVLLQCLRWKKDDVVESEVKKTLHNAIMANPYVPDFITGVVTIPKNLHEYYSPGELSEAEDYAMESIPIWKMHAQKKYLGSNVPTEYDLINLLKSGKTFLMKCTHTD